MDKGGARRKSLQYDVLFRGNGDVLVKYLGTPSPVNVFNTRNSLSILILSHSSSSPFASLFIS